MMPVEVVYLLLALMLDLSLAFSQRNISSGAWLSLQEGKNQTFFIQDKVY
jgi:hypothetical protein